jgi:hypothetical protein
MEKMNISLLIMGLLLGLFSHSLQAQSISCNNLVQISVAPTPFNACELHLNVDMVLEGDPDPNTDYLIEVIQGINVLYSGVNNVIFGASNHLGQTMTTRVTNLTTTNKCWGAIKIEDKAAPVLFCEDVTIACTEEYADLPFPDAEDNCDLSPDVQQVDNIILDNNSCDDGIAQVARVFIAIDASGNESATCTQIITIERPDDVDFPNDIMWECDQYATHSNLVNPTPLHPSVAALQVGTQLIDATGVSSQQVLANTGSGIPLDLDGQYCNYQYSHADQYLFDCGSTFKIVRTWTVLDWCTSSVVTSNQQGEDNVQIIKVVDITPPTIVRAPFTVSANITGQHPQQCTSQGYLPPATVTDNCSDWVIKIYTPIGEANYLNGQNGSAGGFIPAPGLQLGVHSILYQATDECGNIAELSVTVEVIDNIVPTAICDEITDVSLSSDGLATVSATVFDDGSYDNCCMDEFLVRRMDGDCNGSFDNFGPSVTFCCSDVDADPVVVIFRAVDCFGNFNDCMVEVQVNDKLSPILTSCPSNATITCDDYLDNYASGVEQGDFSVLDVFGAPTFYDNCGFTVAPTVTVNLNSCTDGVIVRSWKATDPSNNMSVTCTQNIFVNHVSDWVVEFPADVTAACEDGVLPDFGEPEIFFDECELVGTAFQDQYFYIVPDACYKITRTWTVINWCLYDEFGSNIYAEAGKAECNVNVDFDGDGDKDCRTFKDGWNSTGSPGTPDGYIVYKQTIKVIDEEAPEFTIPVIDGCIVDTDCDMTLVLPFPVITDECSPEFEVDITGDLGFFNNISGDVSVPEVGVGFYTITYAVTDNCGNTSYQTITVEVEDCKKPTPYCQDLIIEIMQTGMVEVWAEDFDAGSFDNCGPVKASFSMTDQNDDGLLLTCDDLGNNSIEVYFHDIYGNVDFCIINLLVQDNMGACSSSNVQTVAGSITDGNDEGVADVQVDLSGSGSFSVSTDQNGAYLFAGVPAGGDYTLTPQLNDNHGNGVTTFDIVLVMRHILSVELLDTPYKIIAADANRSGAVTTSDMVAMRKVILQLEPTFPNNTSWRFVDKSFVFANPQNPFVSGFPEVISINNLDVDELFADFVAIKVGDVNGSATPNAQAASSQRTTGEVFRVATQEQSFAAGSTVTVSLSAENNSVAGYQFTLDFDTDVLELIDVESHNLQSEHLGMALVDEGAITVSWNRTGDTGNELFDLVFRAKKAGELKGLLDINSRFTTAEAYNEEGAIHHVKLVMGGNDQSQLVLHQNQPNPFRGTTMIGFELPESGAAALTIYDLSGKVVQEYRGTFSAGYHQFEVKDLQTQGIYYYTLRTDQAVKTRKMMVQ